MVVEATFKTQCGRDETCDGCPVAGLSQEQRQKIEARVQAVHYHYTGLALDEPHFLRQPGLAKQVLAGMEADGDADIVIREIIGRIASDECLPRWI